MIAAWMARVTRRVIERRLRDWQTGRLTVTWPDGTSGHYGRPGTSPAIRLAIRRDEALSALALRGETGAAEAYCDGAWDTDDLPLLLSVIFAQYGTVDRDGMLQRCLRWIGDRRHRRRRNTRGGSRRNIHAHYDLSNELFATFLDETMTYSSAVFHDVGESLAAAQRNKYARLAEKIQLDANDHVLEIGCGWGGFAIWAATHVGCRVTGITISDDQHALARERVAAAGLDDRVEICLRDYRDVTGTFDKIVSIEMFEALGYEHWAEFFARCDRSLAPTGLMALQTIAVPDHRFEAYRRHADWIQLHVFPGGELASLTGITTTAAERSTLGVQHLEDIGVHYAETLARWRRAFLGALDRVRQLGFDERFIRTWTFYLAICEVMFRMRQLTNLQLVFTRPGNQALAGIPASPRKVA